MDVTTDKVDVEVPAPVAGVVTQIFAADGATVPVGAALAEIDPSAAKPEGGAAPAPAAANTAAPQAAKPAPVPPATPATGGSTGLATHRAHRLADQRGVALNAVRGSGPSGLILFQDVLAAANSPAAASGRNGAAAPPQPVLAPLSATAKVTALKGPAGSLVGAMEQSLTIPTATSFRTMAVTVLDRRRAELNAALKAAGRPEKISFTHLIAYALARAAHDYPAIVTTFRREGGTPSKVEAGVNLGLAVDTARKDGSRFLVVPVIRDADALDFKAFREHYEDLVAKARDNKLTADDMSGATMTLTNPGGIGTVASVPRLMAGQATIIAAGAIGYPPGLQRADEAALRQLGVEKILTLTSTYDHRVVQGAQSGEYLRRVDDLLGGADSFYENAFTSFGLRAGAAAAVAAAPKANLAAAPSAVQGSPASDEMLRAVGAGMAIVSAYRRHGHLAATLDPLGTPPVGDPALDPQTYALTPSLMQAVPASALVTTKISSGTLADVYPKLRETYSSTIAYEVEHLANIEQRKWLREYIESGSHKVSLSPERARNVLWRLTKVETMERYLRKAYIGHKTFSIEGLDVMVPMLEEIMTEWAEDGVGAVFLGMAHRGRLSTIAHVVNRPYEEILAEFEAADVRGEGVVDDVTADVTGDVKYHHGEDGIYQTLDGKTIDVSLANNPSHLEAVDGVVEGRTRALQTNHDTPVATLDIKKAAPILIHGDAAFSAQGVVAEVLNLQALRGYAVGGTIHLIANNQIGFTTDPLDARSTRYASDLAKGFDVPIVHVNADDVEACMAAVHLAIDFRKRFGHDVILDLVGYRRFGHNETDEPAYTQPEMYERIKTHPTVRELFARKLVAQGTIGEDQVAELSAKATARITEAHQNVKSGRWQPVAEAPHKAQLTSPVRADAKVPRSSLMRWSEELIAAPGNFTVHPKLARQLERRKNAFENDGELDWGLAESLAFASLLSEGTPIRLTGQDTERGTFSHRHLVLHDPRSGAVHTPMQHLSDARASFELYNSPLSEYACLAFEYGYAVEWPSALVLWEAQFGDFNNGAQIIIDQFIAAGRAKWGETSRLVMLLPHGYEGAGPEHSSARLERWLQLSADGNVTLANCSTAANYFHLLRLQAQQPSPKPLVVFTPKSLLRLKAAGGTLNDLVNGSFQSVVDDARFTDRRAEVERILLCSGKIYYDLIGNPAYSDLRKTAIVRLELLSPLPKDQILAIFSSYPNLKRVVWVQEEPKNMGARAHVRRRLVERLPAGVSDVEYIGRPYRASPSEGYGGAHAVEQERIVKEALTES